MLSDSFSYLFVYLFLNKRKKKAKRFLLWLCVSSWVICLHVCRVMPGLHVFFRVMPFNVFSA